MNRLVSVKYKGGWGDCARFSHNIPHNSHIWSFHYYIFYFCILLFFRCCCCCCYCCIIAAVRKAKMLLLRTGSYSISKAQ